MEKERIIIDALATEDFETVRRAILETDDRSEYTLMRFLALAGIDDKHTAIAIIRLLVNTGKRTVRDEVKKQIDGLIYWVDRA